MKYFSLILGLIALTMAGPAQSDTVFNVKSYGAAGDGKQLDTAALNKAITACNAAGGGTVLVPAGTYLTGTIQLKSHVTLSLDSGATLLASLNRADYPDTDDAYNPGKKVIASVIYAENADDLAVVGNGTIDGQGKLWWDGVYDDNPKLAAVLPLNDYEKQAIAQDKRGRPQLIRFVKCTKVDIEGIHLLNSPYWNVHPELSTFVNINGLTIQAPAHSPNTDGIDPESCSDVQISNCRISVGDDCVTLKSGQDAPGRLVGIPDQNITISNCVMLHGHGGVTIGSEMSGGVRNIAVTNCVFQGTDIGVRIKSQRGRGGVVEGVTESNIVMQDVPEPFVITTFYHGKDKPGDVFPVDAGTPEFRDFLFSNITARGATDAGSITGLRELAVHDITFTNVHIDARTGLTCTNTKAITFDDVVINTQSGSALTLLNSSDFDTERLTTRTPHDGVALIAPSEAGS